MKIDHILMTDARMQVVKNNKPMPMYKDMVLGNGTKVSTDGTVKMKNGESIKIKDGDMIYMNGNMGKMGRSSESYGTVRFGRSTLFLRGINRKKKS